MIHTKDRSKDANLHVTKEITVHINHFVITGNSLRLNTEIKNRDEIADEVMKIMRYANDREFSREHALSLCVATMQTMIRESTAPDSFVPLDLVNEYLDVIFGEKE